MKEYERICKNIKWNKIYLLSLAWFLSRTSSGPCFFFKMMISHMLNWTLVCCSCQLPLSSQYSESDWLIQVMGFEQCFWLANNDIILCVSWLLLEHIPCQNLALIFMNFSKMLKFRIWEHMNSFNWICFKGYKSKIKYFPGMDHGKEEF